MPAGGDEMWLCRQGSCEHRPWMREGQEQDKLLQVAGKLHQ